MQNYPPPLKRGGREKKRKEKKHISAGKLENYSSYISRLSRVSLTRKKKTGLE